MVEGAAYGAAILTGVGAGVWLDVVDVCKKVINAAGITTPNESNADKNIEKCIRFITN
jgi:glycerol kinase